MAIESRIAKSFAKLGPRNTEQRRIIFEKLLALEESGEAFSTENLWQQLRETVPSLGRATVFRIIEKLEALNALDRIDFGDGTHGYRICRSGGHHHHLTCTKCHAIIEFESCLPSEQIVRIGKQANFSIESHSLTFFGRCANCKKD